ncbi:MAG TPA: peptidoglycan DD-metalloendopeptidase family protein [Candidatus Atribacteria bacterium]|nr:peptidoglycan DD-metalloendopeptidase family protein [Candidatus Atribacteria bacterium]
MLGKKEEEQFTIFWIHPTKGQLKRFHFSWSTLLLGALVLVIGVGLGIGGVLWYQSRIKKELYLTLEKMEETQKNTAILEAQKKEQEEKLKQLTQETEAVIKELETLRELDEKVRGVLEKDLQSRFQKLGIDLSLSSVSVPSYIPLDRFLGELYVVPLGMGGPERLSSISLIRNSSPPASFNHDSGFERRAKALEDNLSWVRTETLARKKSLEEVVEVAQQRDRLLYVVPMRWPTWGRVSSNYGWRNDPFTGRKAWHTGVDIAGPTGRNVVATAEGKVIFTGWNGNYGKCVIVRHQFGYETVYGHLSKILVNTGDVVKKEQIIGQVGSTGRSTGPHLHYEVRRYGDVINPWPYLP